MKVHRVRLRKNDGGAMLPGNVLEGNENTAERPVEQCVRSVAVGSSAVDAACNRGIGRTALLFLDAIPWTRKECQYGGLAVKERPNEAWSE